MASCPKASIAAFIGCLMTLFAALSAAMTVDGCGLLDALVIWPVVFLILLGSLVVLLRVQGLDRA